MSAASRAAIRNLTRENIGRLEGARDVIEKYCVTYRVLTLVPSNDGDDPRPTLQAADGDLRGEAALTALKWLTKEIDLNTDQLRRAEREMSIA